MIGFKIQEAKSLTRKAPFLQAPDFWALNLSSVNGGDQLSSAMHMHNLQVSPLSHQKRNQWESTNR